MLQAITVQFKFRVPVSDPSLLPQSFQIFLYNMSLSEGRAAGDVGGPVRPESTPAESPLSAPSPASMSSPSFIHAMRRVGAAFHACGHGRGGNTAGPTAFVVFHVPHSNEESPRRELRDTPDRGFASRGHGEGPSPSNGETNSFSPDANCSVLRSECAFI